MEKEILNLEEAAELFGVSIKTFIKLLKEEKVPGRKIGREWRFSRKALIDWISAGDSQAYWGRDAESREFFDEVATDWEMLSSKYYGESVKNKLLGAGLFSKNMTVVDMGAGSGLISRAIAGYVKKVIAVDHSGQMLKELQKKARSEGKHNIEVFEEDVTDLSLDKESVDMVCSNMFLHHLAEPWVAIQEMNRILVPGGKVFVADLDIHKNMRLKEDMHDYWMGFDRKEIQEWFEKNGFEKVHFETIKKDDAISIFTVTAQKKA